MIDFLPYLPHLLFINPSIGLTPTFTTSHCATIDTGSSLPACNRVYNNALPTEQEIEDIKRSFGHIPFTWAVADGDLALQALLERRHLSRVASFPAMSIELGTIAAMPPIDDLDIRIIEPADAQSLTTWAAIFATSFRADERASNDLITFFTQTTRPHTMRLYMAYSQGIPVTIGMALNHGTIATLHWVGTLPVYRKMGFGTAITNRALRDLQDAGCTHALLLASSSGKPLYEKMGFKEYMLYHMHSL